ncbi:ADP-ribosylation factor GTPase activating protein, ER-Golgi transport, variant 2 [Cadophora gregata]|uniref:ADP-ribosylation factor GTPase activating protein, ER-Golgi transport, variant 2 n=1 Tax=Cadophora gregata TaxID=51156 RepID=UPI0026DDAC95|nr:ADP-ribosylation factor GTPase activating protein, ER-Golgi transport, variant 2 [Cadophora gregata]KAK0118293.1 ADP-ribosylation factor GTPase activating protein, ER-Golgi transport, variant 2 [Cadophora gregata]
MSTSTPEQEMAQAQAERSKYILTEQERTAIFAKLKKKSANKVCFDCKTSNTLWCSTNLALFLCENCAGKHRKSGIDFSFIQSPTFDEKKWTWDLIRLLKVGGNESAAQFWLNMRGRALLNTLDHDAKYETGKPVDEGICKLYTKELITRARADAAQQLAAAKTDEEKENSHVVYITDVMGNGPADKPEKEFFSEFDTPNIRKPTPPTSRTATPAVIGRTPSPFLNAGNKNGKGDGNGIARTASPLAGGTALTANRTTSSAALRKGTAIGSGPRKANVLGAKKTKLGAKKVTGEVIDFDAAERKAKEEAERIAKLGYDPDAEEAPVTQKAITAKAADLPSIASPTPISPSARGRNNSDVERLGMGMGRLGFGQVGGSKPAAAPKKMGGFGSVGPAKAEGENGS